MKGCTADEKWMLMEYEEDRLINFDEHFFLNFQWAKQEPLNKEQHAIFHLGLENCKAITAWYENNQP
jgi:hypothetical protein